MYFLHRFGAAHVAAQHNARAQRTLMCGPRLGSPNKQLSRSFRPATHTVPTSSTFIAPLLAMARSRLMSGDFYQAGHGLYPVALWASENSQG